MVEIEFSVMVNELGEEKNLLPLLEAFEKQSGIHVNLIGITWMQGWSEITKFGIYGHGPDVSDIGATYIGSLAAMNALRPFNPAEVRALGGENSFFETSWRTGLLPLDNTPWSVPWLGDVTALYYWQDMLEKAGVTEPAKVFATQASLLETLEKLQACGYDHPLALTTFNFPMNLHEAVSWLWGAGGELMSPDYKSVTFHEGKSFEGWKNYFSLLRFISPKTRSVPSATDLFIDREAAITLTGPWLGVTGRFQHPAEWAEHLGIAPVPGIPYVGGSNFVIWKYSMRDRQAFELVNFLASQPARIPASPHAHLIPTRREAVNMLSAQEDPFHRVYLEAMQTGRSFPTARLWGSIEDKLIKTIDTIWGELLAQPDQNLDECLHRHFDPLARRLNMALEG